MSIWGIIFLSTMSAVAFEFLIHMIIHARTGKGKANDKPFSIYRELICQARDNARTAERTPIEKIPDNAFPAA